MTNLIKLNFIFVLLLLIIKTTSALLPSQQQRIIESITTKGRRTTTLSSSHRYHRYHHQHQYETFTFSLTSPTSSSSSISSTISTSTSSTSLHMFQYEEENKPQLKPTKTYETITSTTTTSSSTPIVETQLSTISSPPSNPIPKIIVLGSTGKIGRHVIKNLMNIQNQKIHVVAVVRDYEKACDVLYDEMIRENNNQSSSSKDDNRKPFLQVIVMDLVHDEDIRKRLLQKKKRCNKKKNSKEEEKEDDELEYAVSAARFYNENIQEYINIESENDENNQNNYDYIDPYQPLYDAIQNSTAIISTIGTIRSTIPFVDYIMKPWRIFLRPDYWCVDKHHPYYVNYLVMKKVLDCVEKVQKRRDDEWKIWNQLNNSSNQDDEDEEYEHNNNNNSELDSSKGNTMDDDQLQSPLILNQQRETKPSSKQGDRIRIIRISDLCVANPPWSFVTVLTNIMRSLVFRSQEQCEKLLLSSDIVDTIVLRPGDLVDEKRNQTITSLEVDVDGYLPSPCYVGRKDVADFATVAALSKLEPQRLKRRQNGKGNNNVEGSRLGADKSDGSNSNVSGNNTIRRTDNKNSKKERDEVKHWNVAIGWADKRLTPSYTNSMRSSKHNDVKKAFQYVARKEHNRSRLEKANIALRNANLIHRMLIGPIKKRMKQFQLQQTKPYGLFVFIPLVVFVYPMICSIMYSVGKRIPIVERAAVKLFIVLKPWWLMLMKFLRYGTKSFKNKSTHLKKLIY